ncbi:cytochrome P450 [Mycena metata]|uniref:Cytochrome P450 n=1 Tax=Mycena metata TaxID=1033252 RepID=A0AAD7JQN4_9AGAR|nr:cytochrome P450 [Mycena metata]
MDASSEFLFGRDAQTLSVTLPYPFYVPVPQTSGSTDSSTEFAAALNQAQLISKERGQFGAAWPLAEFWHDKLDGPLRIIREFLDPILREAVVRRQTSGSEKVLHTDGDPKDREVQEGETLVEHLLNTRRVSQTDTLILVSYPTTLRDEILNISVAGRDTTASLLTFVHWAHRAPTPDDFKDMKYLRAVLNESMRLYPPVPFNMRSTTTPVLLPSTTGGKPFYLPAKSKVPFSVFVMHRRTDLWGPDAAEWDPDRFIDERLHKYLTPNPFIFLPFCQFEIFIY